MVYHGILLRYRVRYRYWDTIILLYHVMASPMILYHSLSPIPNTLIVVYVYISRINVHVGGKSIYFWSPRNIMGASYIPRYLNTGILPDTVAIWHDTPWHSGKWYNWTRRYCTSVLTVNTRICHSSLEEIFNVVPHIACSPIHCICLFPHCDGRCFVTGTVRSYYKRRDPDSF
jgi:hypothetical protein